MIGVKVLFVLFFLTPFLHSMDGIGIILGDNSGITLNHFIDKNSLSFTSGWKTSDDRMFYTNFDYFYYKNFKVEEWHGDIDGFFGFGIGLKFDEGIKPSFRLPFGFRRLVFKNLDVFIQITPFLKLYDETKGDLDWGIGARYYF